MQNTAVALPQHAVGLLFTSLKYSTADATWQRTACVSKKALSDALYFASELELDYLSQTLFAGGFWRQGDVFYQVKDVEVHALPDTYEGVVTFYARDAFDVEQSDVECDEESMGSTEVADQWDSNAV